MYHRASTTIQKLPPHLIDQIKAGEVIESPSALLKELLENAIDAQATKIDLEIKDNGITLLKIRDNGQGMTCEDLPLAFERHATSKIRDFSDLYKLHSYGFRGEALASAASIARINCNSSTGMSGGRIEIEGGEIKKIVKTSQPTSGTSISIQDLFFNTPARMKFIRSEKKEEKALKRIIVAYAIAHPEITFSIKWDDQKLRQYPAITGTTPLIQRSCQLFPWLQSDQLLFFFQEYDGHSIQGVITKDSTRSRTKRVNLLLANKRLFTEQSFHYLITQTAKKIWKDGEQGSYIIQLAVPPNQIDVNVHPSKTRIKFEKHAEVYALISASVKNTIAPLVSTPTTSAKQVNQEVVSLPPVANLFNFEHPMTTTPPPLQPLNSGVSLYKHHQHYYLILDAALFAALLQMKLTQKQSEEVPLLITPTVTFTASLSDNYIDFFQQNKIILHPLTDNTYLLQALPNFLTNSIFVDLLAKIKIINEVTTWQQILPLDYNYKNLLEKFSTSDIDTTIAEYPHLLTDITPQLLC